MKYDLNKSEINYTAEGEKTLGNEVVLLHQATDLTAGRPWEKIGYVIDRLFTDEFYSTFNSTTKELLLQLWRSAGLTLPNTFELDQYHLLASSQQLHLSCVEGTKLISIDSFPVPIQKIEQRISEICNTELIAKNPFDNQSVFHFRVIRPLSNDNNPLHRDVWLEDYANCINLYIPVAGSNSNSSLSIVPSSHHWPENKVERTKSGAVINGVRFNVPAVTSIKADYEIVRPDPKENEVLVFSPYLIHGGAVNLNENQSRISIELRLWKKS
ncbi:MAG TPA: hypothetical protein DGG95_01705 [Cytophagales bacterium]|jgi:hypothetical protein|nr:hypothetical protein [Cytophagales bacterium]